MKGSGDNLREVPLPHKISKISISGEDLKSLGNMSFEVRFTKTVVRLLQYYRKSIYDDKPFNLRDYIPGSWKLFLRIRVYKRFLESCTKGWESRTVSNLV